MNHKRNKKKERKEGRKEGRKVKKMPPLRANHLLRFEVLKKSKSQNLKSQISRKEGRKEGRKERRKEDYMMMILPFQPTPTREREKWRCNIWNTSLSLKRRIWWNSIIEKRLAAERPPRGEARRGEARRHTQSNKAIVQQQPEEDPSILMKHSP